MAETRENAERAFYLFIKTGELGKLEYNYSNRLNLGKIRRQENFRMSFKNNTSLILLLVLISGWVWGVLTHRHQVFPYNLVAWVKDYQPDVLENKLFLTEYTLPQYENPEFINHQIKNAQHIYNFISTNSINFRNQLKNKILLPNNLINITEGEKSDFLENKNFEKTPDNSKILKATYYGINHFGVLEKSLSRIKAGGSKKRKLLIYNQGHGGLPYNFDYYVYLSEAFRGKGYDLLTLTMTNLGFNQEQTNWFPTSATNLKKSFIFYINSNHGEEKKFIPSHDRFRHYYDEKFPNILPLSLVLSGNYYIINHIIEQYDEVVMMGISGGGWYTTMLSALIPKIQESYSFASSFPKSYTITHPGGDFEQTYSSIWKDYDYWHFYFLSLFSDLGEQKRSHFLIFNDKDNCCFFNPHAQKFSDIVGDLSVLGLKSFVVNNDRHSIDIKFVEDFILKESSKH